MPDDTEQPDSSEQLRLPLIQWLHTNAAWLSAVGAIAAVIALGPALFSTSPDTSSNSVTVNGDNQGAVIAGRDVNTTRDPQDKEDITLLIRTNKSQQKTIELLLSQLSESDQQTDTNIREEIADAVTNLSGVDNTPSRIAQAETALAKGDTELAQELYKADAENKTAAGKTQLQEAAQSYRHLGALAFLDNTAAALEAYQKATEVWPDDIRAWNQLGRLYMRTGQLEQAIEAYSIIGKLAETIDEVSNATSVSLSSLGDVHRIRGELDEAVEMHEKSLALNTELGFKGGVANDYANLGNVHSIRGELDEAVEMYEKSLALDTELGDKEGMANQYSNLGNVHRIRGELDEAVEMHEKALALFIELGHKEGMAIQYNNMGNVYTTYAGRVGSSS